MKILIVDDTTFMRYNLANIFKGMGCEVAGEAANGQEGVELYKKIKPDLVTMDITMPVMDGLQALKAIKQHDPGARVVMVSSMGQREFVLESIKSGAAGFIVKPFHPDKIKNMIERLEKGLPEISLPGTQAN
ncbi:chemotaxis regulator CheY [Desulfocucumis palustris]|uniref:Stage 0 sporulation protein A homolog n=1 Tax=Desulfocucumis palustris TaxID=1898651 RepID=A0A2L2XFW2_9FIRM|nr:chemotaxis regulator CheY [Desulfocucumis palustris]